MAQARQERVAGETRVIDRVTMVLAATMAAVVVSATGHSDTATGVQETPVVQDGD